jgi:hypothetical protein
VGEAAASGHSNRAAYNGWKIIAAVLRLDGPGTLRLEPYSLHPRLRTALMEPPRDPAASLDVQLLSLLVSGPLCITCVARRIICDKRDVLSATHTLINNGAVRCEFTACPSCGTLELVVRSRATPSGPLR